VSLGRRTGIRAGTICPTEELSPLGSRKAPLNRDRLLKAMRSLLPIIERLEDDVRIVGTASSLLRGIELPAGDVDILARTRATVDELSAYAAQVGARPLHAAAWQQNPAFGQYFARFDLSEVRFEFSTVETPPGDVQIGECINSAPWQHFDVLVIEGRRIPVVASELRLLSEVERGRPERWKPIGAHLVRHGYDPALFDAALTTLLPTQQAAMQEAIQPPHG
jgi:hypothetical protein